MDPEGDDDLKELKDSMKGADMKEEKLFSIGEICKICDIKASRLRYYDRHGIVKPYKIEETNGYRYYSKKTLEEIPVLVYLQQQGFSLSEAQEILKGESFESVRGIFSDKVAEYEREILEISMKKNSIESWIDLIDEAREVLSRSVQKIALKYIPEIETTTFSTSDFEGRTFDNLLINTSVAKDLPDEEFHTIGALYLYYPDGDRSNWDDVTVYIKNQVHYNESHIIGGFSAVTCYHTGSFDGIDSTVARMKEWVAEHNFELRGDILERSVIDLWTIKDRDQWVMEIYLPVTEKNGE